MSTFIQSGSWGSPLQHPILSSKPKTRSLSPFQFFMLRGQSPAIVSNKSPGLEPDIVRVGSTPLAEEFSGLVTGPKEDAFTPTPRLSELKQNVAQEETKDVQATALSSSTTVETFPSKSKDGNAPSAESKNTQATASSVPTTVKAFPAKPKDWKDLGDAQEELFQRYLTGENGWSEMVAEAKRLEHVMRAPIMKCLDIKSADYQPESGEDYIFREGTDPSSATGRGICSDEDLTTSSFDEWHRVKKQVEASGWTVKYDGKATYFAVPELNAVIWQPDRHKEPMSPFDPDRSTFGVTVATDPEIVDPSSKKPKFAMEFVLAMINKGQVGLSKPVEEWGTGYARYETLIQTAKSTYKAMEKSGLKEKRPEEAQRLWQLCKMEKSPEELGIFKPGDSEEVIKANLKKEQKVMQELSRESFVMSWGDLKERVTAFRKNVESYKKRLAGKNGFHPTQQESLDMEKEVRDVHRRLVKISTQIETQMVSRSHLEFAHHLFRNDPSTYVKWKQELEVWKENLNAFVIESALNRKLHLEQPVFLDLEEELSKQLNLEDMPSSTPSTPSRSRVSSIGSRRSSIHSPREKVKTE